MTLKEVMQELESYGDPAIKKIFLNHGIKEPLFGVRVGDTKKIVKKIKKNHELSLQLYDTGNSDAMYLAGLIADESQISKKQLQKWVENAPHSGISEYTVAWVASESKYGFELGMEWIKSENELIATAGWATLAYLTALKPDEELDINTYRALLNTIKTSIHEQQNRVKYTMNGFVIAVGSQVNELHREALKVAKFIGKVDVYMGKTACKVPDATTYINKVKDKGRLGKKRKTVRC